MRLGSGEGELVPVSRERELYEMRELGLEEGMRGKWGGVMEMCGGTEAEDWGPITCTDALPQGWKKFGLQFGTASQISLPSTR